MAVLSPDRAAWQAALGGVQGPLETPQLSFCENRSTGRSGAATEHEIDGLTAHHRRRGLDELAIDFVFRCRRDGEYFGRDRIALFPEAL